jgi:hypothetical protein
VQEGNGRLAVLGISRGLKQKKKKLGDKVSVPLLIYLQQKRQKNFFFLKHLLSIQKKRAKKVVFRTKIKASKVRLSQEILQNFLFCIHQTNV